jgi:hypothetical protein
MVMTDSIRMSKTLADVNKVFASGECFNRDTKLLPISVMQSTLWINGINLVRNAIKGADLHFLNSRFTLDSRELS